MLVSRRQTLRLDSHHSSCLPLSTLMAHRLSLHIAIRDDLPKQTGNRRRFSTAVTQQQPVLIRLRRTSIS